MTRSEWNALATEISADIGALTRASVTQTEVRAALQRRQLGPTEEFFIDQDAFGSQPTDPRVIDVAGARVKVWKLHRAGLRCEDVKGADLYYEIAENKFALVQYKSPNARGRVRLDDPQLMMLESACPVECPPANRFACGSWYALRSTTRAEYFSACEARRLFCGYRSRDERFFVNGLAKERFHEDFGLCRIGARTHPVELESCRTWSVNNDRVLFHAVKLDAAE